jgi:outer membrane protein insertion porin family
MKKIALLLIISLFLSAFIQADVIKNIIVKGNKKISYETILFYLKSQKNSTFSQSMLKQDFNTLWETGFFENIEFSSEDAEIGKVVTITVVENPILSSIKFNTGRKVNESDIKDKLQEENLILTPMSYITHLKFKKVESIIRKMLLEKGFYNNKVELVKKVNEKSNSIDLTINVEQGPKTKVAYIEFEGIKNTAIKPGFLIRGVKNNKINTFFNSLFGKDVYKPEKLSEDLEEIKLRFEQKGYIEAKIGKPKITMVNRMRMLGAKVQKMVRIIIPVDPGPQYRYNGCTIEGNKILKTEFLKTFIHLKKGDVYNVKKRNENVQDLQKFYQGLGYLSCQATPEQDLDPEKKLVTLNLKIFEGKIVYLKSLTFVGNTYTKDRVLRREFFLREGEILRANLLEDSVRRMKQLGLVDIQDPPFEFNPDPQEPQRMHLKVFVTEMHRQMINFNFGYSGYNGLFIALGYSTKNFLGVGEQLSLSLSHGERMKNYNLAFTEPRLFHLPANFGINFFKQDLDYVGYFKRKQAGFSLSTNFRFLKYFGSSLMYRYSNVEEDKIMEVYNPYFYFSGIISSLNTSISYNTVDSPIFPYSGMKFRFDYRYSGGFLGGDVDMHRYNLQFVKFFPLPKRKTFGMQLSYQYINPFGKGIIPRTEKIYLGGERSIRGFEPYRIGPRNQYGYTFGGVKAFFMNFEFHLPLTKQLSLVGFYDIGNAYGLNETMSFNNVYQSMGAEFKIFIPMLNVPFRLIFAYNPRLITEGSSHFVFRLGVGPSFN